MYTELKIYLYLLYGFDCLIPMLALFMSCVNRFVPFLIDASSIEFFRWMSWKMMVMYLAVFAE